MARTLVLNRNYIFQQNSARRPLTTVITTNGTPVNSPTFTSTEVFSSDRTLVSGRLPSSGRYLIT